MYEWHKAPGESEGSVSLIASSSAEAPIHQVVISPSGNNISSSPVKDWRARARTAHRISATRASTGRFPPGPRSAPAVLQRCLSGAVDESRAVAGAGQRLTGAGRQLRGALFPLVTVTAKRKAPVKCAKGKRLVHGQCVKRQDQAGKREGRESQQQAAGKEMSVKRALVLLPVLGVLLALMGGERGRRLAALRSRSSRWEPTEPNGHEALLKRRRTNRNSSTSRTSRVYAGRRSPVGPDDDDRNRDQRKRQ